MDQAKKLLQESGLPIQSASDLSDAAEKAVACLNCTMSNYVLLTHAARRSLADRPEMFFTNYRKKYRIILCMRALVFLASETTHFLQDR